MIDVIILEEIWFTRETFYQNKTWYYDDKEDNSLRSSLIFGEANIWLEKRMKKGYRYFAKREVISELPSNADAEHRAADMVGRIKIVYLYGIGFENKDDAMLFKLIWTKEECRDG